MRLPSRLGAALAVLVPCVAAAPHAAADVVEATYAFAWRGLEVGRFEVRLERDPGRYRARYTSRSTGFLAQLFPFASSGSAEGAVAAAGLAPERYEGQSRRRSGISRWAVTFAEDRAANNVEVTGEDGDDREPVPTHLQRAPDPLSLALRALTEIGAGGDLTGSSFDGKRATRLRLTCADTTGTEEVEALGPKPVPALACELRSEVVAGASRRWRERPGEGAGEPGRLWLGVGMVEGASWPVRAELRTRFGRVTARLVALERRTGS